MDFSNCDVVCWTMRCNHTPTTTHRVPHTMPEHDECCIFSVPFMSGAESISIHVMSLNSTYEQQYIWILIYTSFVLGLIGQINLPLSINTSAWSEGSRAGDRAKHFIEWHGIGDREPYLSGVRPGNWQTKNTFGLFARNPTPDQLVSFLGAGRSIDLCVWRQSVLQV